MAKLFETKAMTELRPIEGLEGFFLGPATKADLRAIDAAAQAIGKAKADDDASDEEKEEAEEEQDRLFDEFVLLLFTIPAIVGHDGQAFSDIRTTDDVARIEPWKVKQIVDCYNLAVRGVAGKS